MDSSNVNTSFELILNSEQEISVSENKHVVWCSVHCSYMYVFSVGGK